MRQKWKKTQYIEISIDELFCFQDKLNAVKDDPEKVWEVVDAFFWEVENQLELDPDFIKELQTVDIDTDFTSIDDIDVLFEDFENPQERTAQDYVNYVIAKSNKKRYDIPFTPRHDF